MWGPSALPPLPTIRRDLRRVGGDATETGASGGGGGGGGGAGGGEGEAAVGGGAGLGDAFLAAAPWPPSSSSLLSLPVKSGLLKTGRFDSSMLPPAMSTASTMSAVWASTGGAPQGELVMMLVFLR